MMMFSKRAILDVRLLGAIAAVIVTLIALSIPEPVQKLAPSRVARGEFGAQIVSLAVSPTSAQIATTNRFGRVSLRGPEREWQIDRFLNFPGYATDVAYAPDGRTLAAVGSAPGICLWDVSSPRNEPSHTVMVPIQQPKCIVFSPDGRSIALTSYLDGTILLWDLATRRERMVLHQLSPVTSIAFSPDGRWLATGGGVIGRSSFGTSNLALGDYCMRVSLALTTALAFSRDGALLASAGFPEHYVCLWDLGTGRVCRLFEGHSRSVNSVAFSPDGSLLATASNDGTLGLWTVATGRRRASLDGQAMYLRTVTFSPDGQTLALATGDDDDVRLWDLAEVLRSQSGSNSAR